MSKKRLLQSHLFEPSRERVLQSGKVEGTLGEGIFLVVPVHINIEELT